MSVSKEVIKLCLINKQREVAETLEGEVEAYEVKRNPKKYNPARLREKVGMMQRHQYRGQEVKMAGLSMEESINHLEAKFGDICQKGYATF